MRTKRFVAAVALGAAAFMSVTALPAKAQQPSGKDTSGYWVDPRGAIVKDPYSLCWRSGYWSPALANCECDKDLLPKEVCSPPAPRPAAAPAPAPKPAAAPKPKVLAVSSTGLFEFDKYNLTDAAKARLDKEVVARLPEFASIRLISIEGHTDRIGTHEYNQKLSERRADTVKAYLVSKGADPSKIETIGMGKTVPQKSCPDPSKAGPIKTFKELVECLAPNRRAVVQVSGTAK